MDSAHSGDLVPVAAKDIGRIEGWKKLKWYCLGCTVRVFAVACDPDKKFDKVPHFSLKQGHGKHADDCNVAGLNLLIKKARKQPIQSRDILLGYLPHSVVFRDSITTIGEAPAKTGDEKNGSGSRSGSDGPKGTQFHRPSRVSIEPVCRAHAALRDAELREMQSLDVEGCLGSNYRDTFYQLQDIRSGDPPQLHSCIFYGELRFRARPNYDHTEKLILTLNRGVRSDGNRPERRYRLIIRWQEWGEQLRTLFIKEIETKRLATNRRYDALGPDKSSFMTDIIVYFLGQQVEGSPTDFEVSEHRKVAIVVEPKGIYKDYPNHGFLRKAQATAEPCQPLRHDPPPHATERPSWVTPDFSSPAGAPEPRRPDPPVVPWVPVTRERLPARSVTSFRQSNPIVADGNRTSKPAHKPPFAQPSYYSPPKPRRGIIQVAKEWILSLFD